jgi:antitoxin (DNA-binding transcriptional repressor) of toxin-antitoxin stability system
MSTISVSDLKKRPAKQWGKSAKKGDLVVLAQGQPVAVLVPVEAGSVESTLSAVRSVRALRAQAALQKSSAANRTNRLTMAEIDGEIAAARRVRRAG